MGGEIITSLPSCGDGEVVPGEIVSFGEASSRQQFKLLIPNLYVDPPGPLRKHVEDQFGALQAQGNGCEFALAFSLDPSQPVLRPPCDKLDGVHEAISRKL